MTYKSKTNAKASNDFSFCNVPELPEREFAEEVSVERARLIRVISKK